MYKLEQIPEIFMVLSLKMAEKQRHEDEAEN
jgi:hypothetical protein